MNTALHAAAIAAIWVGVCVMFALGICVVHAARVAVAEFKAGQ